ncbi:MAG: hypothetical protein KDD44_06810 [Bdellovibrionales bacterium]|nr:hypothetical protein [Bdellovibrionales bacterium]
MASHQSTTESAALSSSAINLVFVLFVGGGILFATITDTMPAVTDASFEAAKGAVELAISLVGIMALWLGLVRVLEAGGLMHRLAVWVRPVMVRLFPDVPPEHPAMSAMVLNMSANMLGLGNAATPLGIKAMVELDRLNPFPGTATNAMCLFLAINTSSVTLLPLGVIGVRAAAGSSWPAEIFLPTLLATSVSTAVGVVAALLLGRRDRRYRREFREATKTRERQAHDSSFDADSEFGDFRQLRGEPGRTSAIIGWGMLALFLVAAIRAVILAPTPLAFATNELVAYWLMPGLMLAIICFGLIRGVRVYEAVTDGAKQGFEIAIRIIPFLVAILVAIGMFRASGAMELAMRVLAPVTDLIYLPPEVLPMALIRPLSGSGAFGIMSSLVQSSPDSYSAYVASTMQGSTETTFYVLAVYFGSVGIVRLRHALIAALLADGAGIIASCLACRLLWSH